ncbi:MAG: hypothetical protein ABH879_04260 [archaeon]
MKLNELKEEPTQLAPKMTVEQHYIRPQLQADLGYSELGEPEEAIQDHPYNYD